MGHHFPPQPYIKAVKKFTWRIYALSERLLVIIFVIGKDRADLAAASAFSFPRMFTTWNPTEHNCFAIITEMSVIFYDVLHKVWFEFKSMIYRYTQTDLPGGSTDVANSCSMQSLWGWIHLLFICFALWLASSQVFIHQNREIQVSFKPWKVLELKHWDFQAWKALKKGIDPGKVLEFWSSDSGNVNFWYKYR